VRRQRSTLRIRQIGHRRIRHNASMTALLDAYQVSASVDGEVLLAPVTAKVSAGTALAVLGQNGSGKTTLLRIFAGLLRPTFGTVSLGGSHLDERCRDTRRAISPPIGSHAYATDLTVREQLRFIATSWGIIGTAADDRADSALEQWGIPALSRRFAHELSSGQTQLFALATAFNRPFDVVILDEPEQRLDRGRLALVTGILAVCGAAPNPTASNVTTADVAAPAAIATNATPWGWLALSFQAVTTSAPAVWSTMTLVIALVTMSAIPLLLDNVSAPVALAQSRRWQTTGMLLTTGDAAAAVWRIPGAASTRATGCATRARTRPVHPSTAGPSARAPSRTRSPRRPQRSFSEASAPGWPVWPARSGPAAQHPSPGGFCSPHSS